MTLRCSNKLCCRHTESVIAIMYFQSTSSVDRYFYSSISRGDYTMFSHLSGNDHGWFSRDQRKAVVCHQNRRYYMDKRAEYAKCSNHGDPKSGESDMFFYFHLWQRYMDCRFVLHFLLHEKNISSKNHNVSNPSRSFCSGIWKELECNSWDVWCSGKLCLKFVSVN